MFVGQVSHCIPPRNFVSPNICLKSVCNYWYQKVLLKKLFLYNGGTSVENIIKPLMLTGDMSMTLLLFKWKFFVIMCNASC